MHVMKIIKDVTIDGVSLDAGHQYNIPNVTEGMLEAQREGKVDIKSADTTVEERKADVAAWE